MLYLEQNLRGFCSKFGIDFQGLLSDFNLDNVLEFSLLDLEAVCEEFETDLHSLLFSPIFQNEQLQSKIQQIKFLVLDVDGVLTDGGMFVSESGDQFKRYSTKDGLAILHLTKRNFQVAFLSSGFTSNMVKQRAELLGVQRIQVSREPKFQTLDNWRQELQLEWENICFIGDDINDLEVMQKVGLAVCPADAMQSIQRISHLQLTQKGGHGCVREFVDNYLLKEPINQQ